MVIDCKLGLNDPNPTPMIAAAVKNTNGVLARLKQINPITSVTNIGSVSIRA